MMLLNDTDILEALFWFIYFNVNPLRNKILVTNRDEFLKSLTIKIYAVD